MRIPKTIRAVLGDDFVLYSGPQGDVFVRRDGITLQTPYDTFRLSGDQRTLQLALNSIA